ISLGIANGRRFTFACGLGIDAQIVRAVDARGRRRGRRPGDHVFAWELTKLVAQRRLVLRPTMEIAGHGRVAFAVVGNGDPYTFAGRVPVHATPLARFEEGIDVVAPRQLGPAGTAGLAWATLARPGRQTRSSRYVYLHDADAATIYCDEPTPLQVDGEDIGDVTELELGVARNALKVLT
ncbi:MAG: diacylglycerol/lipid kinase family protein, partial [Gaiellaceae bacterium]